MKQIIAVIFIISGIYFFNIEVNAQTVIWRQIIGEKYDENGFNAFELRDKGYLAVGFKQVRQPGTKFLKLQSHLVKLESNGHILWEKLIGDSIIANSAVTAIEDPLGNIFLPYQAGNARLMKLTSSGNIIWDKDFPFYNIEIFKGISLVNNFKTIVILSQTFVEGISTASITKLDTSGNIIWNKPYYDTIPSISSYESRNNSFFFSDDYYFLSGDKSDQGFIIKTDTSGNVIWNKSYLQTQGIFSIAQNSENTFIASGWDNSGGLLYCLKYNQVGDVIWARNYIYDTLANHLGFEKIVRTLDGNFALGRASGNNFGRLGIIDSLGNFILSKYYYYNSNVHIQQNNINATSDSGYIIVGSTGIIPPSESFETDLLVYKIDKYGNTVSVKNFNLSVEEIKIDLFPNPYNFSFTLRINLKSNSFISIGLYNILGEKVHDIENKFKNRGVVTYNVNTNEMPTGVYFVKIEVDHQSLIRKILFLK